MKAIQTKKESGMPESCDRLMQTAKDEIAKENNYLNLVKTGKLKSKDRLEVLEKIALYEREGRFGEDVEEDPPTRAASAV